MKKDMIEALIIGALEGGSNYWYYLPDLSMIEPRDGQGYTLSEDIVHAAQQGKSIPIHDIATNERLGCISKDRIKKAVKLMHDNHPAHYAAAITENHDACTSDVFLQLIVLGTVVYG